MQLLEKIRRNIDLSWFIIKQPTDVSVTNNEKTETDFGVVIFLTVLFCILHCYYSLHPSDMCFWLHELGCSDVSLFVIMCVAIATL